MILCKKAEGTDGYFVQAEGGEREVTLEVLHILRAIYDHRNTAAGKARFRRTVTTSGWLRPMAAKAKGRSSRTSCTRPRAG